MSEQVSEMSEATDGRMPVDQEPDDWLADAANNPIPTDANSLLDQEARVIESKKAIYFSTAEGQGKAQLFQRLQKMLADLDAEIWLAVHMTRLG